MLIWLIFAGLLCGFINGIFSTGGGIISVFAMSCLMRKYHIQNKDISKNIFATTNAIIIVLSIVSLITYYFSGKSNIYHSIKAFTPFIPYSIIGSVIGVFLLKIIKNATLKKLFAILVIYCGVKSLC